MKHTFSLWARSPQLLKGIVAFLLVNFFMTAPAHAYLDPGTGTMIVQIILGGIAGLAVAGKLFWSQITGFFAKLFGRGANDQGESTPLSPEKPSLDTGQPPRQNDGKH